ncbi:hypothetical protein Glove_726g8 [Diversispora epigaea]|uniref:Uncharacterized protein n=1 Tax=Diversispora epigaea TaxID=1348612 RepID=A0A397G695_9GLOM|nr:hypothetical protein Glove_726g8 [Diversispora epigaea]
MKRVFHKNKSNNSEQSNLQFVSCDGLPTTKEIYQEKENVILDGSILSNGRVLTKSSPLNFFPSSDEESDHLPATAVSEEGDDEDDPSLDDIVSYDILQWSLPLGRFVKDIFF